MTFKIAKLLLLAHFISSFFAGYIGHRHYWYSVAIGLTFALFIFIIAVHKNSLRVSGFVAAYICFGVLGVLSWVWSIDPSATTIHIIRLIPSVLIVVGGYLFITVLKNNTPFAVFHAYWLAAFISLIIGLVIYDYSAMPRTFLGTSSSGIGILFPLAMISAYFLWSQSGNRLFVISIPMFLLPIAMTASVRGIFLITVLIVFFIAVMAISELARIIKTAHLNVKRWTGLLSFLILFAAFVYMLSETPVAQRALSFAASLQGEQVSTQSALTRVMLLEVGWSLVHETMVSSSILIGNGINSSRMLYENAIGVYIYSHSNPIEIFLGLGALGLLLFYFPFFFLFWMLMGKYIKSRAVISLVSASVVFSVVVFSGMTRIYYHNDLLLLTLAAAMIGMKAITHQKHHGVGPKWQRV